MKRFKSHARCYINILLILIALFTVISFFVLPYIQVKSSYGIGGITLYQLALYLFNGKESINISNKSFMIFESYFIGELANSGIYLSNWLYIVINAFSLIFIIATLIGLIIGVINLIKHSNNKSSIYVSSYLILPSSILLYLWPLMLWILGLIYPNNGNVIVIPFVAELTMFIISLICVGIILIWSNDVKVKKELLEVLEKDSLDKKKNSKQNTRNTAKAQPNSKNKANLPSKSTKKPAKVVSNSKNTPKVFTRSKNKFGDYYFVNNKQMKEIIIDEGITYLGKSCFENCSNLSKVIIPKSVKNISSKCFYKCMKLTSIIYEGNIGEFQSIVRGGGWLALAGTRSITCKDGILNVNPYK